MILNSRECYCGIYQPRLGAGTATVMFLAWLNVVEFHPTYRNDLIVRNGHPHNYSPYSQIQ